MSAVKLGYVVVYPNPKECKGMDTFLRLDTRGPAVKVDTNCYCLEQATVFDEPKTASNFADMYPVAGRVYEIHEVHEVTQRKLAVTGPVEYGPGHSGRDKGKERPSDTLRRFMDAMPKGPPLDARFGGNGYNKKIGLPDGAIPMGQGIDAVAQDHLLNTIVDEMAELGVTPEELLKNPPAGPFTLNGLKGWPKPSAIDYQTHFAPDPNAVDVLAGTIWADAAQEPADGHSPKTGC